MGDYGERNVARPHGRLWEARRKSVLARQRVCVYCGRVPVKAHVAHIIPLVEGIELRVATSNINHPLNSPENLAVACDYCNLAAGGLTIRSARRKIAGKLGKMEYDGPVPDTTMVQAKLDALMSATAPKRATTSSAEYRPDLLGHLLGQDAPPTTNNPSYSTIAEVVRDLSPLAPEELAWLWDNAGDLACECGPADGSRCLLCLPR